MIAEAKSYDVDQIITDVPEVVSSFNIHFKIGSGTFSSVYVASLKGTSSTLFAVKHIVPICSTKRIQSEIECLSMINSKYVISLDTFIRHNDHVVLIMPFFEHDSFRDYVKTLSINEIQVYMVSLFSGLEAIHCRGIIHRDIKPSNVLFNRKAKVLKLIDFGLSHKDSNVNTDSSTNTQQKHSLQTCSHVTSDICNVCIGKPKQSTPREGTSGFRAFEVLLKYPNQTTTLDIWSAGVILLCLLSTKYPFFNAKDDVAAIMQIVTIFGSQNCVDAAKLLGKELCCSPSLPSQSLSTICHQLRYSSLLGKRNKLDSCFGDTANLFEQNEKSTWITAPSAVYELLQECLQLNPKKRVTATQALTHLFFANNGSLE